MREKSYEINHVLCCFVFFSVHEYSRAKKNLKIFFNWKYRNPLSFYTRNSTILRTIATKCITENRPWGFCVVTFYRGIFMSPRSCGDRNAIIKTAENPETFNIAVGRRTLHRGKRILSVIPHGDTARFTDGSYQHLRGRLREPSFAAPLP